MKKIYVEMIADLFHYGHVEFLRKAKALGDHLVVGVLSDEWAKINKREPIIRWEERARIVEACRYVDQVLLLTEPVSGDWLVENNFHVAVKAFKDEADRIRHVKTCVHYDLVREVELPYERGISTTDIIKRIQDREKARADDIALIRQAFAPRWNAPEWLLAEHMLQDVGTILETHGITYFLTYGSLLGAIRHQGVIPWDDDIDLAISERDEQRLRSMAAVFNKSGYGVIQCRKKTQDGTEVYYKAWMRNRPSILDRPYSWPFIDIFVLRSSGVNAKKCKLDHREFPCSYIFPLKESRFGRLKLPVPGESADLLTMLYGADHMTTCLSTNFIHRHERRCAPIARSAADVMEAGCFVSVHDLAKNLLKSVPVRENGWSQTTVGESIQIVRGNVQLRIDESGAMIWEMLDGKLSIGDIFARLKEPQIESMGKVLKSLSKLLRHKTIRLVEPPLG